MRKDVLEIIRSFQEKDKVLFSRLDEFTWVLVPDRTGCAIVIQDLGDSIVMRTGIGIDLTMDYEAESSREMLPEILSALQSGDIKEYFAPVNGDQIASSGYKVEYPSGQIWTQPEKVSRQYAVRLPVWNA
ncbi:MAG TPA: hypothetical protein VHU91_01500 [Mycobacteriales bacterium]|jgi:hypothetical protein|nr:hypothetical protein [Mycobacteriales bacterium]